MMTTRRRTSARATLAFGALIATTLMFNACGSHDDESAAHRGETVAVRAETLRAVQEPDLVVVSGQAVARNRVEVASRIAGRIVELPAVEGTVVRRGDLLARIDSPESVAGLEQAKAMEAVARTAFEVADRQAGRMARLAEEKVVTPRDKELTDLGRADAESGLRRAEAARRMAEESLSYAVVRASQDGVIVERRARTGDLAAPGMPILVLENTGDPEIRITLPSDTPVRPFVGMGARVSSPSSPETSFAGTVTRVSPSENLQTVVAYVSAGGFTPATGTFVSVALEGTETVEALRVPAESLVTRGSLTGVFVASEGQAVLRWIRLDGVGRVQAGLRAGEAVILSPPADLKDGSPVEVRS